MTTLDRKEIDLALDEVRRNVDHAEAQHSPHALTALRAAEKALAEVERTRHHDMYERAYFDVQGVLDGALGPEEEDGAGAGIVADVALLAQRYADLREAVLHGAPDGSGWRRRVAEIESADLRESAGIPS